jgi:hypothetical protein
MSTTPAEERPDGSETDARTMANRIIMQLEAGMPKGIELGFGEEAQWNRQWNAYVFTVEDENGVEYTVEVSKS